MRGRPSYPELEATTMNSKHVKVGEFYNQDLGSGIQIKVLIKSRRVEPKSGVTTFEAWSENDQEGEFVPARKLSPITV